jgi:hypothetical protein
MSQNISLKEAERKAFNSAFQDGLWDIFIGCVLLEFVIGPFLGSRLGAFWSAVVFLPFFAFVFLVLWLVRRYVVTPRIGVVRFGPWRKSKIIKFNIVAFIGAAVAVLLAVLSAVNFEAVPGWIHIARFSFIILIMFMIAAYFLDFKRLYLYGVLIALSPIVGEWLYVNGKALHHGLPIAFGITAGVIILIGLVLFVRLLRITPSPMDRSASVELGE